MERTCSRPAVSRTEMWARVWDCNPATTPRLFQVAATSAERADRSVDLIPSSLRASHFFSSLTIPSFFLFPLCTSASPSPSPLLTSSSPWLRAVKHRCNPLPLPSSRAAGWWLVHTPHRSQCMRRDLECMYMYMCSGRRCVHDGARGIHPVANETAAVVHVVKPSPSPLSPFAADGVSRKPPLDGCALAVRRGCCLRPLPRLVATSWRQWRAEQHCRAHGTN